MSLLLCDLCKPTRILFVRLHGLCKLALVTAAYAAWQAAATVKTNTVEPLGELHVFFTDC